MAARKNLHGSADHQRATAGGSGARQREVDERGDPGSRGERADVLPVAEGVRGDEDESGEASEGAREGEPATEAGGGRSDGGQHDPEGSVKRETSKPRAAEALCGAGPAAARGEREASVRGVGPGSIDTTEESEERG